MRTVERAGRVRIEDNGRVVGIGPALPRAGDYMLTGFQDEAARMAVENDVHVVAISSLAGGHKTLLPQLAEELGKLGRDDIMVVVGGVIPAQDYEFLYAKGAAAVFGPGTVLPVAARRILEQLNERLGLGTGAG